MKRLVMLASLLAIASCDSHQYYTPEQLAAVGAGMTEEQLLADLGEPYSRKEEGGGREVEHSPALSITAAWLPDVRVEPFHLEPADADALAADPSAWYERVQIHGNDPAHFILLPDPFSCDAGGLLRSLDIAFPDSAKIGGLASGASRPGENALFAGDLVYPDGAVGLILDGNIDMDTIVAQGCRPVGGPLFITAAARNRVLEIDGRRPTEVMAEIFHELEPGDRDLFRRSLFVGVVMNEGRSEYGAGDFLIRNVVGVDPNLGHPVGQLGYQPADHGHPRGPAHQHHPVDLFARQLRDGEQILVGE